MPHREFDYNEPTAHAAILAAVVEGSRFSADEVADLTMKLLAIDSPPGHEREVAHLVASELRRVGVPHVWVDDEFPDSPSVVALIAGREGPVLQWHGHLDAIATGHAAPVRTADRIIARGANDMKGTIACLILAAGVLAARADDLPGSVLMTFHGMHEEGASAPLLRLFERGIVGNAALSAEGGFDGDLMLGADGLTFWDAVIELPNEPAHEVRRQPDDLLGTDVLRELLEELRAYAEEIGAKGGSLFLGSAATGDYYNRVPTTITLQGTRRHVHGAEKLADVERGLRAWFSSFAAARGATVRCDIDSIGEAYRVDESEPIVDALDDAYATVLGGAMVRRLSPAVSNATHFAVNAGIPVVGYGASLETAHSNEEIVELETLVGLVPLYAATTVNYLSTANVSSELTPQTLGAMLGSKFL